MPLRLRVLSQNRELLGDDGVREFCAHGGTIGRAPDNDWVLPDPQRYISGRHALLDFQAGSYYLVDMSRNGVFVNGADVAVGRGHPQRLFDGDRLRIGDFELAVEISPDAEADLDDGMRDSIVRAQLVPEDEHDEPALVPEQKLLEDSVMRRHLSPSDSQRLPVLKASEPVSAAGEAVLNRVAGADQRAAARVLEAAGLSPDVLAGSLPSEWLRFAGQLLRIAVEGLMEMLRTEDELRSRLGLPQGTRPDQRRNPLRFALNVEEALRYLFTDRGEAYLPANEALKGAFAELQIHHRALVAAMTAAAQQYAAYFDPEELEHNFEGGARRGSLLAGINKVRYWDLYNQAYVDLARAEEGQPPTLFGEELARAYSEAMSVKELRERQSA